LEKVVSNISIGPYKSRSPSEGLMVGLGGEEVFIAVRPGHGSWTKTQRTGTTTVGHLCTSKAVPGHESPRGGRPPPIPKRTSKRGNFTALLRRPQPAGAGNFCPLTRGTPFGRSTSAAGATQGLASGVELADEGQSAWSIDSPTRPAHGWP